MAGDWIQIDHDLNQKPEVIEMAADLGIDCFAVSGRLINLWGWFDSHTIDGKVSSRLRNAIDAHCAQEGFVRALEVVGWMREKDGMLCVVKFKERHGKSGKNRALAARRASRFRNANAVTKSAPEKRREEKSKEEASNDASPPKSPPKGDQYAKAFTDWWFVYPRKVGKEAASKAYAKAGKRLVKRGMEREAAVAFLLDRCRAFSQSPIADGEFCPHASTWLNEGRYDDDPQEWQGDRNGAPSPSRPLLEFGDEDQEFQP